MGRPPMAIGTHGNIRFSQTQTDYRARAQFRGFDGQVREIERSGKSKAKAERELKLAINQEIQTPSGGEITAKTKFRDAADRWFVWQEQREAAGERSPGTIGNYRSMLKNHVLPALGELRLYEVTVPRLDQFFPAVQAKSSAAHSHSPGRRRRHPAVCGTPRRDYLQSDSQRRQDRRRQKAPGTVLDSCATTGVARST